MNCECQYIEKSTRKNKNTSHEDIHNLIILLLQHQRVTNQEIFILLVN